jgi:hypothetical protein
MLGASVSGGGEKEHAASVFLGKEVGTPHGLHEAIRRAKRKAGVDTPAWALVEIFRLKRNPVVRIWEAAARHAQSACGGLFPTESARC